MTIPALITRLEALTGPDRDIDADIQRALGLEPSDMDFETWQAVRAFARTFTSSIDDALTLLPEGWTWGVGSSNDPGPMYGSFIRGPEDQKRPEGQCAAGSGNTPAIALTIACLRAMEEGN